MTAQRCEVRHFNAAAWSGGTLFFTHFAVSFDFQSQCALLQKEREHRECCLEVQRLCAQLEKAQGKLHSQELELERLRPLEKWLGQYQREQQVSRVVGTNTESLFRATRTDSFSLWQSLSHLFARHYSSSLSFPYFLVRLPWATRKRHHQLLMSATNIKHVLSSWERVAATGSEDFRLDLYIWHTFLCWLSTDPDWNRSVQLGHAPDHIHNQFNSCNAFPY